MTPPSFASPRASPQFISAPPRTREVGTIVCALSGALAGHFFSLVSPASGALFGVVGWLTIELTFNGFDRTQCATSPNSLFKIAKVVLPILAGIGAGALTLAACGAPITFSASLILSAEIGFIALLMIFAAGSVCVCGDGLVPRRTF